VIQRLRTQVFRAAKPIRARSGQALVNFRYLVNPALRHFVDRIKDDALTYLERGALLDLYKVVRTLEWGRVDGIFVEAGCALGGSALSIAFSKRMSRALFVYDVFEMIPPPSLRDDSDAHKRYQEIQSGNSPGLSGHRYYGYRPDLCKTVLETFHAYGLEASRNNVHFVKGRFEDTLVLNSPVALAHIDCDWYDSVTVCLERIVPKLAVGGVLVIDDYTAWSGCRKAVDDYFRSCRESFVFEHHARLHIIRK
jgi:hypothetical protein